MRNTFALAILVLLLPLPLYSQPSAEQVAARAEELARMGQTVQAETMAAAYLKDHPDAVPVNVVMAELAAYRRAWPEALTFYESALRVDAADAHARKGERDASLALALHQRNSGDAEAALQTLEHAHAALPDDVPLLVAMAVQAQSMHRLKTALQAIDAALNLGPANDRVLYTAAGIHFDRGESAVAAQQYRSYLAQHPDDASAHFGLGRALRVQQQNEAADRELRRSIELRPVQTEAYYQLGEIALEAGREDEARADFAKTLDRMPAHGGALAGMGQLLYRSKDYAGARTYLERAVSAAPDYQPGHYYLGLTLRRLGETAGAERELATATELAAKQQGRGAPGAAQ